MSETRDQDAIEAVEPSGAFAPTDAAGLLAETRRQARRELDVHTPLLALTRAAAVLVGYGAVWWSVRGQDPYTRPDGALLVVVAVVVVLTLAVGARVTRRATAGVSGPSLLQRRAVAAVLGVAYAAALLLMVVLYQDGVDPSIVYGVYPATAPLIVGGAALAGALAAREEWLPLGAALAIVAVAALSAFTGPVTVWLATGVGCCLVLVGYAAAQTWRQRA
jgi:peptidoglycan/LPS O-acetylase OafA/YrhL